MDPKTLFWIIKAPIAQSLQNPLIKEYTLNYNRIPYMI